MIKKYPIEWVQDWCQDNGWTDLFVERRSYWAFPPHAVLPLPIPNDALRVIKAKRGLSPDEKLWRMAAWMAAGLGAILTYCLECPLPLIAAFAFCAVMVALMEDE
jgi:hypothetical protein